MKLLLVGGGRMGEALLTGLRASEWAEPEDLAVVEKLSERREVLESQFPGVVIAADFVAAAGAVVAVKPNDVEAACSAVAEAGCERVLSIAAGVTLGRLQAAVGR